MNVGNINYRLAYRPGLIRRCKRITKLAVAVTGGYFCRNSVISRIGTANATRIGDVYLIEKLLRESRKIKVGVIGVMIFASAIGGEGIYDPVKLAKIYNLDGNRPFSTECTGRYGYGTAVKSENIVIIILESKGRNSGIITGSGCLVSCILQGKKRLINAVKVNLLFGCVVFNAVSGSYVPDEIVYGDLSLLDVPGLLIGSNSVLK